jgi:hypothetical protein
LKVWKAMLERQSVGYYLMMVIIVMVMVRVRGMVNQQRDPRRKKERFYFFDFV